MKVRKSHKPCIIGGIAAYAFSIFLYGKLVLCNSNNHGEFGDMFGGFNAFFAGLGFLGVVYAIYQQKIQIELQRRELRLQRKELRDTRTELERSAKAHEQSQKALTNQQMIASNATLLAEINRDIDIETKHLLAHHNTENQIGDKDLTIFTIEQVEKLTKKVGSRIDTRFSSEQCLMRNLNDLIEKKKQRAALLNEIETLKSTYDQ